MEKLTMADLIAALDYTEKVKREAFSRSENNSSPESTEYFRRMASMFYDWHAQLENQIHSRLATLLDSK